jgi:phosphate starvation-inducible PhoH-like protein
VYETGLHNGNSELLPVEYLRGRSFNDVVIVDEAQNLTPEECYSILTRVGEYGKLIMIGDHTQNDLKGKSGIAWVEEFIEDHNLHEHASVVKATSDDIVRSGFCKAVIKAKESQVDTKGEYYEEH